MRFFTFKAIRKEVEANHFAVHLLMPREMVEAELVKMGYFEDRDKAVDINKLADIFGVSGEAMTYGLIVHGYK